MPRYGDFHVQDLTAAVNKMPPVWTLVSSLNLFDKEFGETEFVTVDVIQEKIGLIDDKRRGGPRNYTNSEDAIVKRLEIPFFPLDGGIRPSDLQNLRKYGTANDTVKLNEVRERVMRRVRMNHSATSEKAMVQAVKGLAYAPSGTTEQYNYYTVFGQTQKEVFFDLAGSGDPIEKAEEARLHITENAQDGGSSYEVTALCSKGFFAKLLKNADFKEAYTYFESQPNPLRTRVGGNSVYREFVHGNVRYIEYAFKDADGNDFIETDIAYMMPVGMDGMFRQHFAPADTVDDANTTAQEIYMWEKRDRRKVEIESESSFLCVNYRPELVVKCSAAAS
ncbi:hypothetical protein [Vibrio phage vB_VibM_10AMN]|uniref:Major capsid protein n=1 Tax=Staphylococcus phage vB_VibM_10AMN12 TaxID=3076785 RepID=A0AA96KSM4_9CAUD|nr:hypothetical protein [Vibrio phage vB_VibM_10AMN]WNO47494.1 hypothetical protein [Staphylococcus phage vB_VibM_10AMN12]